MDPELQPMRIGALAQAAEVGVETIRYYQRRGLLGEPARPARGLRFYPVQYVERIRFIKRAQRLGFSLEEIAALLTLDRGTGHRRAQDLAKHRLAEIESKIADLEAMRATLADLVRRCERTEGRVACPIIATLGTGPRSAQGAGGQTTVSSRRQKKHAH